MGHQGTGNDRTPEEGAAPGRAPAGCRVYAVGDIHGRADLLRRLHGQIRDDAKTASELRKVVVYMGDYVDRGPDSFGVIDMLIHEPLEGFERHHLKGNHEDMLMGFLETGSGGETWIFNGGRDTLESYEADLWDIGFGLGNLPGLGEKLHGNIPEDHLAFLAGLELRHREGGYLFVHAGLRPGVALEDQDEQDFLWIRHDFLDSDADYGMIVVHGHSIHPEPDIRPNRIGIDTGAWRTGHLTALVLEGDSRRFLRT